jgi:hypothetical protein
MRWTFVNNCIHFKSRVYCTYFDYYVQVRTSTHSTNSTGTSTTPWYLRQLCGVVGIVVLASVPTATNHNVECSAQSIGIYMRRSSEHNGKLLLLATPNWRNKSFPKKRTRPECCWYYCSGWRWCARQQFHSRMLIAHHPTCKITCVEQCTFGSVTVVMHSKLV